MHDERREINSGPMAGKKAALILGEPHWRFMGVKRGTLQIA
jgi:hypothetical protein